MQIGYGWKKDDFLAHKPHQLWHFRLL
jgi:hypothetical protein